MEPDDTSEIDGETAELAKRAELAGLPAKVLGLLPAFVVLLGITGLPAFGVAVLAYLASSVQAARRMREFDREVQVGLGLIEAQVDDLENDFAEDQTQRRRLEDRVRVLETRVDSARLELLSTLFEDYMSSLDEERRRWLRGAIRSVLDSDNTRFDLATKRTVIAGLRMLAKEHILELQRLYLRKTKGSAYNLKDSEERSRVLPLQAVLLATGMLQERVDVDLQERKGVRGSGIVNGMSIQRNSYKSVSKLGVALVQMLDLPELEPTSPGAEEEAGYYVVEIR